MENTTIHSSAECKQQDPPVITNGGSSKTMIKGGIMAALILLLLVPMRFVGSLVMERKQRQSEIIREVSDRWAVDQTIVGPFLYIPSKSATMRQVILLPENLDVAGNIITEKRKRSIYNVLLYNSNLQIKGNFGFHLPDDVKEEDLLLSQAKICVSVNDIKGIRERIAVVFNGNTYTLTPGIPEFQYVKQLSSQEDGQEVKTKTVTTYERPEWIVSGFSASLPLTKEMLVNKNDFAMNLKIKGSEQLHFLPLSANSSYKLTSAYPSPSFDGNTLPDQRTVTDSGFHAEWTFNEANLPFTTVLTKNTNFNDFAFGVSLLQPADQYAQTERMVKYALLIIGLTFALFFVIELMQNKPMHPVQYVLIGLALVIFYTLLLSLSEFISFNYAYVAAAFATTALISLYTKGHFGGWKIPLIFTTALVFLYAFIYVLVQLEDTALLIGSIGLFIILSIAMYFSNRINWYNKPATAVN